MCGISSVTVGWVLTEETARSRKPSMLQRAMRSPASGQLSSLCWWYKPFQLLRWLYWKICGTMCPLFSIRNIFQTRTLTGFRDEHIWVSIVDPPSRSPFTRAQRVSCCMSLLLCTMAINIAFWNIPVDENSPVLFSIGNRRLSKVSVRKRDSYFLFFEWIPLLTFHCIIKHFKLASDHYTPYQMYLENMISYNSTLTVLSGKIKYQLYERANWMLPPTPLLPVEELNYEWRLVSDGSQKKTHACMRGMGAGISQVDWACGLFWVASYCTDPTWSLGSSSGQVLSIRGCPGRFWPGKAL